MDNESRILNLAVTRGFITREDLSAVTDDTPTPDPAALAQGRSIRLQTLIRAGLLSEALVAELAREVDRQAAPTLAPKAPVPAADPQVVPAAGRHRRVSVELPVHAPRQLGRYQLVSRLGEGGMGEVYQAWDPQLNRHVALKVLKADDAVQRRRFLQEARAQARVDHPHVCRIYEAGEPDGRPVIAMQFIRGQSLRQAAEQMTLEEKVRVMRQVAEALHAAHRLGLIHRDVKPGNVMMERTDEGEWRPYVMDFGLAREQAAEGLTVTGEVLGTPQYMAPEQARGDAAALDRRTDIYSIGATLYELLAGRPPFIGDGPVQVLLHLLQDEPETLRRLDARIPRDLETITMKCLEKEPQRRYASARAVAEDLDRFLNGEPVTARPGSWTYRLVKKIRKNRALVGLAAAALVTLALLTVFGLRAIWQTREQARLGRLYQQTVQEMERLMLQSRTMPLHDTTRERQVITGQLLRINNELARLGEAGQGPAAYALGCGYLLLDDPAAARAGLERAWQSGYQGPEVAYALGRALGELYQHRLQAAEKIRDPRLREAEERRLDQEYLQPAVHYLRQARAESQPLAEARLAFYEKDFDTAVARAEAALAAAPWDAEAVEIMAGVQAVRAKEALREGRYDEALSLLDGAEAEYRRQADMMRSDAGVYLDLSRLRMSRMWLTLQQTGQAAEEDRRQALAYCDQARQADPDSVGARVNEASVNLFWGGYAASRGQDPRSFFETAETGARAAVALAPQSVEAGNALGEILRQHGAWTMRHGGDPRPRLEEAAGLFRRSLALNPNDFVARHNLSITDVMSGVVRMHAGEDPRPLFRQAVASYGEVIAHHPRVASTWLNRATAYISMAQYAMDHGENPRPDLEAAIADLAHAAGLMPGDPKTRSRLGDTHALLGEYLQGQGSDPAGAFRRAVACFDEALAITPDLMEALRGKGIVLQQQSEYLMNHGQDAGGELAAARECYERALAINATDPHLLNNMGNVYVALVRHALLSGSDTTEWHRRAVAHYEQALAINPQDHVAAANRAYEFLQLAEHHSETGADVSGWLAEAERSLDRSRAVNPRYFNGCMFQGDVARLKAESRLRDGRVADDACARGLRAYADALALNESSADLLYRRGRLELLTAVAARCRGDRGAEQLAAAAGTFRAVTARNADYAPAHALGAETAFLHLAWGLAGPDRAARIRADGLAAAERALAINPRLTRARWARAGLLNDGAAAAALYETVRSERPGLDETLRRLYGLGE